VRTSEPIFNVPAVVSATLAAIVIVHLLLEYLLSDQAAEKLFLALAFVPTRPTNWWTFVTYALVHGSWLHLGLNGVWLLAFGTPIARRFGALRYLAFFAVTAAAGAAAHLAFNADSSAPMVGASASISGFMAAAIRFAFQRSGPLGLLGRDEVASYRVPALPLTSVLRDPRVLIFLAVWFALNLLFGIGSLSIGGDDQAVAWQAHIGGFLAGLLAFALFDPVKAAPAGGSGDGADQATIH
jgi:membrane associated rhomboid family serine protease